MNRPFVALAVVALMAAPLLPLPARAVAPVASTTTEVPDNCSENFVGGPGKPWGCVLNFRTTQATSGFDAQLSFAWVESGGFVGPDGVSQVFNRPIIHCPAAANAACETSGLHLNASAATWAPDTWGFYVGATRLGGDGTDQSFDAGSFIILRRSTMSVGCFPSTPALFTHFYCEATVTDGGGAGVPSTPESPTQVHWPFDDGANQHAWGDCNLIPQASPYTAACGITMWVSFVEDGNIPASWDGDANHSSVRATGHIVRSLRATDIVPGCVTTTILIGESVTCHVEVFDLEWEDTRFEQGIDDDVIVNSSSPGSGLTVAEAVGCHADLVPFPGPSTCSIAFTPTTHGIKVVRFHIDHNSIYAQATTLVNVNVLRRATTTVFSCSPASVPVNTPTACVANVTDATGDSPPTGSMTFSIDGVSPVLPAALQPGGAFSAGSCALVPSADVASSECTVSFTPSLGIAAAADRAFTLRGSYGGDATHETSADTEGLVATKRSTSTTPTCTADILIPLIGAIPSGTCTAAVADASPPTAGAPIGTVGWVGDAGTGLPLAFPSATLCTLDAAAPYDCSAGAFTPTTIGDHVVTARYGGDADHLGSQGADTVHVHAATATAYTGAQAIALGNTFTASATVASAAPTCYQDRAAGPTGVGFYLDRDPTTGAAGAWLIPSYAGTTSGGKATLSGISTTGWLSGVYVLAARFLGDSLCDASFDEATLVIAGPGDAAYGGGWVALNGRTNFAFVVHKVPNTSPAEYRGEFLMINNGKWQLRGELENLVKRDTNCSSDGLGALTYASVDPVTGRTTWLPATGDPLTSFGLYFEDAPSGRRATDKWTIHIGHIVYSPPEPNALPGSTDARAPTLRNGNVGCR